MSPTSLTTGQIARIVDAELQGPGDIVITRPAGVDEAVEGEICFIRSPEFVTSWLTSGASAALVGRDLEIEPRPLRAVLVVDDADLAMVLLLEHIAGDSGTFEPGVHPSALIDPAATISPNACIGPNCVIGADSTIAAGTRLVAHVCVGAEVTIGESCTLHPGVVLYARTTIGSRCLIHGNAVIGADGFGFRPDPSGKGLIKIPHIGMTRVGDDVEIGAGTCIDRGKLGPTTIGDGTKIDNLVQIGHNCTIGRCCVICGHTGIGGSVKLGDGVTIGGKVGLPDNITIGSGATVGGGSLAHHDIPAGETWIGVPAQPIRDAMACHAVFRRLPQLSRTVKRIDRALEDQS
jgi:UDP-3-O-[3-hydroxymyristoyl] glucosamine N-acyltransferase